MEDINYLQPLLALLFVTGLIFLLGWALKRWNPANLRIGKTGSSQRMQLIEQLPIDPRRKLLLLRCDEAYYLLLLGAQAEQLIPLSSAAVSTPSPLPAPSAPTQSPLAKKGKPHA